jgi:hypothetical protein
MPWENSMHFSWPLAASTLVIHWDEQLSLTLLPVGPSFDEKLVVDAAQPHCAATTITNNKTLFFTFHTLYKVFAFRSYLFEIGQTAGRVYVVLEAYRATRFSVPHRMSIVLTTFNSSMEILRIVNADFKIKQVCVCQTPTTNRTGEKNNEKLNILTTN